MKKTFHDQVLDLLEIKGPLSALQIANYLEWTQHRTHAVIARARQKHPQKAIRISAYIPHPVKGPAVCVYSARAGADEPKPEAIGRDELRRRKNEYQAKARTETKTFGHRGDERIVIPVEMRPYRNSTTTGQYLGAEPGYRGKQC